MCFGFGVTLREGDREYFYAQLDRLFPKMKQRYIRSFGNAYVCNSPNNSRLTAIFKEICEKHDILWQVEDVFAYLQSFEAQNRQLSLF
jgi:hypothetical protein